MWITGEKVKSWINAAILDSDEANSLIRWGPDIGDRLGELLGDQTRPTCNQLSFTGRTKQTNLQV